MTKEVSAPKLTEAHRRRSLRAIEIVSARRLYSEVYEFSVRVGSATYKVKTYRTRGEWTWGEVRRAGAKRATSSKPWKLGHRIGQAVVEAATDRTAEWESLTPAGRAALEKKS